jgi:hypothetical protein
MIQLSILEILFLSFVMPDFFRFVQTIHWAEMICLFLFPIVIKMLIDRRTIRFFYENGFFLFGMILNHLEKCLFIKKFILSTNTKRWFILISFYLLLGSKIIFNLSSCLFLLWFVEYHFRISLTDLMQIPM